ncbi:MAG: hypothetical protein HOI11_02065 [Gammaproteobacteria bacterium]|jgi:hypothetical protein|nr:hypothetical protein [Gammaproteobacteria bacterium]MBT7798730.1 hypothetical protein [Gammaproteobacteria bacterium]
MTSLLAKRKEDKDSQVDRKEQYSAINAYVVGHRPLGLIPNREFIAKNQPGTTAQNNGQNSTEYYQPHYSPSQ